MTDICVEPVGCRKAKCICVGSNAALIVFYEALKVGRNLRLQLLTGLGGTGNFAILRRDLSLCAMLQVS